MIQAAREVLDKTYKDGLKYAKAVVMLSGICEYAETMSDLSAVAVKPPTLGGGYKATHTL